MNYSISTSSDDVMLRTGYLTIGSLSCCAGLMTTQISTSSDVLMCRGLSDAHLALWGLYVQQ